jgi:hypothetical protein
MKIGTMKKNFQSQEIEMHLELGPALRTAVGWVLWHGMWIFLGFALERAYLLTHY